MSWDLVSAQADGFAAAAANTLTFTDGAPSAGDLDVLFIGGDNYPPGSITGDGADWAQVCQFENYAGYNVWYRVADGSEDADITAGDWAGTGYSVTYRWQRWTGQAASSPLDTYVVGAGNYAQTSTCTATTPDLAGSGELVLAFAGLESLHDNALTPSAPSWSSGFTDDGAGTGNSGQNGSDEVENCSWGGYDVSGSGAVTATADWTESGAANVEAVMLMVAFKPAASGPAEGTATLPAEASLTALGEQEATAPLTASASLTPLAEQEATASLAAGASLATVARVLAAASLAATGTLTTLGTQLAVASLPASASLAAVSEQEAAVSLTAGASLTAVSEQDATAELTAGASLTALAEQEAGASLAASASLTAPGAQEATAALDASASLSATATLEPAASLPASAALTAVPGGLTSGTASLAAGASLTALGTMQPLASMSATAALSALAELLAIVTLTGTGTLTAAGEQEPAASLDAASKLTATPQAPTSGTGLLLTAFP